MSDQDKDLPSFGQDVDSPRLRQKLEALREAVQKLMGLRGDADRAAVRWGDVRAGKVGGSGNTTVIHVVTPGDGGGSGGAYTPDLTMPPTPTGLMVTPTPAHVIVEFDAPIYAQGHGHKQTNVYATTQAADDVDDLPLASAVRVFSAVGPLTIVALPSEPFTKWRVWIRYESNDGVESNPAGGAFGAMAVVPALGDSIEDGGIDDIKVANLSAAKLTAGDGVIGGRLKSANYDPLLRTGWIVRPDGHVDFRSGYIGGVQIGEDFLRSDTALAGWGWQFKADGTGRVGGLIMEGDALKSSNFVASTSGFRFDADGTFELNGIGGWIRNQMIGDKEVSGGKLQDFAVDTLQIAGDAVIIPDSTEVFAGFTASPALTKVESKFTLIWDDDLATLTEAEAASSPRLFGANPFTASQTPFIPITPPYSSIELRQQTFYYTLHGAVPMLATPVRNYQGQRVALFLSALEFDARVWSDLSLDIFVNVIRVPAAGYAASFDPDVTNEYLVRVYRSDGAPYPIGDEIPVTVVEPSVAVQQANLLDHFSITEESVSSAVDWRVRGGFSGTKVYLDNPPAGEWSYQVVMRVVAASNSSTIAAGNDESVDVAFTTLKGKAVVLGLKR